MRGMLLNFYAVSLVNHFRHKKVQAENSRKGEMGLQTCSTRPGSVLKAGIRYSIFNDNYLTHMI